MNKKENKTKRPVGRPITITEDRAKLQVFISKDLINEAKHYCFENDTSVTYLTEKLFREFFKK